MSINNSVLNNNISTNIGSALYGVVVSTSNYTNITGNNITTNSYAGHAVFIITSSNSTIQNNIITAMGNIGYGAYFSTGSNSNNISSNTISTSGTSYLLQKMAS